ncbi:diguanylate phosphodiesterase [Aliidiomarina iranensis]|uniref:Diguanylate phosphodiesterase n=1 Tax=Aliidiomarina iranensis TaxID=1434071 RepID=A0A432VZU3_9GAMM|nr:EAL domain-containing protein [Aliidiomarina iranensis]RUO22258.1 diguanylate phosphodiesterase [Aliidiomarina iranensis]
MQTIFPEDMSPVIGCTKCAVDLPFNFTFAFQPIVNVGSKSLFGYEALVRGCDGSSAWSILSQVTDDNRYMFDQACRVTAIRLASKLKLDSVLSINFLPNAVYEPAHCIRSTLQAAKESNFPIENLMFEITESEQVHNPDHLTKIFKHYAEQGFVTAIDDFGAGHAGLNLLSSFQPRIMKFDMELVRDVHEITVKQIIADSLITMCMRLGITPLAEGIEKIEELNYFKSRGVELMQGYYFAKPGFECLPEIDYESF